jgi:hypothetical protein
LLDDCWLLGIAENHSHSGVGYSPSDRQSLTYNNFFGNELGTQWRFFNDLIAKVGISDSRCKLGGNLKHVVYFHWFLEISVSSDANQFFMNMPIG